MNAAGATQDVTKPDFIELAEVRAKIETADKSTIFIRSKDGLYNRKTSMLTLTDRCRPDIDGRLRDASRRGGRRHQQGRGRVRTSRWPVFTKDTTLTSDRFEVENSGEVVRFIGSVVMNLQNLGRAQQPGAAQPAATAKPQQPAAKR